MLTQSKIWFITAFFPCNGCTIFMLIAMDRDRYSYDEALFQALDFMCEFWKKGYNENIIFTYRPNGLVPSDVLRSSIGGDDDDFVSSYSVK